MSNKEFLENFEFYKKNPNEYRYKMKSYGLSTFMIFLVTLVGFGTKVATILDEDKSNLYTAYVWMFFLFGGLFTLTIYFIESCLNRKITKFNKMLYKGLTSELFPNIEHPVINYYKEQIRADIHYRGGLKGETAYAIYQGINDSDFIDKAPKPTIQEQAINEIGRVHGLKDLEVD